MWVSDQSGGDQDGEGRWVGESVFSPVGGDEGEECAAPCCQTNQRSLLGLYNL